MNCHCCMSGISFIIYAFSHSFYCFIVLSFEEVVYQFFLLWLVLFFILPEKSVSNPRSQRFLPMFYSFRNFIVLALTSRSVIHFKLIFWYMVWGKCPAFPYGYLVVQHHLLKRLPFPHWVTLASLLKIKGIYLCWSIFGHSILFHLCNYDSLLIIKILKWKVFCSYSWILLILYMWTTCILPKHLFKIHQF